MEVLRDFAQSEPRSPLARPSTLAPGAFEPAAAASTRRILLSGLSSSNPLPPLTVRLLHGRLLRLDLLADLSHLLLRALSASGLHLHALSLHSLFPDPSDLTLPFALNSASRLPNPLPVGEKLHARSLKLPSHSNPYVLTSLLNFYGKCGLLDHARTVFDEMRCPCTVSWTALITAYMNAGRDREAVAIAREAFASGIRPDSFTAMRVLTACARAMDLDTGEVVWRAAEWDGIAGGVFVATAAVNLYVKCGEMAKAREVFDKMPEKDAVAWGAIVGGYISNGQPRETLEFFFAMQTQGLRPDCYTVADALSACTQLGEFDLGRQVVEVVDWNEFLDNPVLGTALLNMYTKCGRTWDAWSVFQQMRKRDIIVWNTMILGLGMAGHGKTAFALVGQMEKSGMKLNGNTFIGILCSCAHNGNVKDGQRYFHHMAQLVKDGRRYFHHMAQLYDITPQIEHYGCMVDLLSRAGLLQEAQQLINDMPMQANAVVWGALLGGCKMRGDVELAEHVLKQLSLLEPPNSANYVMLSNIYSNRKRRQDAAKLRLDMKVKGLRKVRTHLAGLSFVMKSTSSVLEASCNPSWFKFTSRIPSWTWRSHISSWFKFTSRISSWFKFTSRIASWFRFTSGTPKLLKAKKGGLKKQQNKKKFIKKNGKSVNMEKDEAILPADTHHSGVPIERAETTQNPSIDALMLQPGEGAERVEHVPTRETAILQPDGESRKVEQESPSCTVMLQAHEEARKVEQEPPSDTPMIQHDEEASSVKQEPLIDTAMPQPPAEDRRVSSHSLPGLKVQLIAGGEEQVRAAGRRTRVQRDSSRLRQVAPVHAVCAGSGGEDGQLLRPGVGRFVRAYSWVEFSGKVHEFRIGDKSHPLTDQIYKKLDELGMEMKNMGYNPSTDVVLFDLEDEKEHTLVPYSETLAIAFGLLSTRPGEAIRVTNNLRVCTDCHTAIKLISRIDHREIIVQDNSRLHCFRDGCCSCNDHW